MRRPSAAPLEIGSPQTGFVPCGAQLVQHCQRADFVTRIEARQSCGTLRRRSDVFHCLSKNRNLLRVGAIPHGEGLNEVFFGGSE